MTLRFLIIVPHGYCDGKIEVRHCDRRALEEANKLKALVESKGHKVDFFIADRFRAEIDYNRKPSRGSAIRNAIREKLIEYNGDRVVVFEMHSFPDNYADAGYDFKDARVALLSIPKYEEDMFFLTKYVQEKTGFEIVAQRGTETNDIQWDTSNLGDIHHYLIEFRENKKDFPVEDSDIIIPYILEGALKRVEITGGGFILAALPKALYITTIIKHYEYIVLILFVLFILYVIENNTEVSFTSYFGSLL
jgi:hypothetical protein